MEIETFFFDTYAFHEIIDGNPNYKKYVKNTAVITTKLNLIELYYGLLVKYGRKVADKHYDFLVKYCIKIDDETIKRAMLFKAANKKKNLFYVDCIGYIISLERNVKFLTGDKQFKDLPNVEFVK